MPKIKLAGLLLLGLTSFTFAQTTTVGTAAQLSTAISGGATNIVLSNSIALGGTNIVQNASSGYTVTISGGGLYGFTGNIGTNLFVPAVGQTFTLSGLSFSVASTASERILANNGTTYFDNISVTNSTSSSSNSLIRNNVSGIMTITNSVFSGNTASGGTNGGVINNLGSSLSITGSTFSNNTNNAAGGALYNTAGATAYITDTSFTGDKVTGGGNNGGAIDNEGTLYITAQNAGVAFSRNTSGASQGGAIRNGGALTITADTADITFSDNVAGTAGGAIQNANGATLNLVTNAGNIIFTGANTSSDGGNALNAGGIVNVKTNGAGNILFDTGNGITGLASTNAAPVKINVLGSGAGQFIINSDASKYLGLYNQTSGTTVITSAGTMFASSTADKGTAENYVSGSGVLQITDSSIYYGVTLGKVNNGNLTTSGTASTGGTLINYTTSAATMNIGGADTSRLIFGGTGSVMTFDADSSVPVASYNLAGPISGSSGNTVNLNNGNVTLALNNYADGTTYGFNNDTLSINDPANAALRTVNFSNVTSNNTTLNFNISLTDLGFGTPSGGQSVLTADHLNAAASSGTFNLGAIGIVGPFQDDGLNQTYSAQVLFGGAAFNTSSTPTPSMVVTSVYEYLAGVDPANQGDILLTVQRAADSNSLNAANTYVGNSSFNMTYFVDPTPDTYYIGSSLSNAAAGQLLVQGVDSTNSLLDGGGAYSFFKLTDATNLTLQNLAVQNSSGTNGSVLDAENASATADLNNLAVQNNTASGLGGAIYQNSGADNITVTNSTFTNNHAADGGAVYVQSGTVNVDGGASFSGNTAAGQGGAIYNADTVNLDSSAGNITFSGNSASGAAGGNDIYNSGTLNVDGTGNAVVIGSGLAGAGVINKSNGGEFDINADSSNYTGVLNNSGGLTKAAAAYFNGVSNISGGTVELAQGSSITGASIFNIGAAGELLISTNSNMTLAGG
ncbi:MAG: hypothetical protein LBI01_03610, partial [Elusimicrobium sp.]|nr:hypothetical protein [Elusimicrobium sp.]